MDFKDLLAISGLPGLYIMKSSNKSGVFVESLEDQKVRFISGISGKIVNLENISIYTEEDAVELIEVFRSMKDNKSPIPDYKGNPEDLKAYFKEILPDYDEDRVFVGDMKKVIKWYNCLEKFDLLTVLEEKKESKKKEDKADTEEKSSEKEEKESKTKKIGTKAKKETKEKETSKKEEKAK